MRNVPIPKNYLLDTLIEKQSLKNTRALAEFLGVTEGALSKVRYGINKPSADLILLVYDKVGMSIEDIRALIAQGAGDGSDT